MTIAGQLAHWRSPFAVMPGLDAVHAREALRDLEQRFAGVAVRKPEDFALEKVWARLVEAREKGNDMEGLDRRTLRHGPWVMFSPWNTAEPLGADEEFVRAYLKRLRREPISAAVLSLAAAFLHDYPKQLRTFAVLCRAIPVLLGRSQSRRCRVLTSYADRVGLFKANGPKMTWEWLCNDRQPLSQALTVCCLTGSLGSGRFAEEVFLSALRSARSQLRNWNRETVDRLLGLAVDNDEARLQFPAQRVALAESLLMPFTGLSTGKSEEVRTIQTFLIAHYGDPRLNRANWQGVNEDAIQVVLGWLVEDTLEDFFRLLEYTSQGDEIASRHWRFRKAFWSTYLRAGLIQDAWVVLAHDVDAEARHRLNMDQKGYGRFARGGGVQRNHAVLVMRIGPLVITEWSHSGKFRIWNEGQNGAAPPRFYQPRYTRGQLVSGASYEGSHGGSEHGTWQTRLANYIKDATGISFQKRDLMPAASTAQALRSVGHYQATSTEEDSMSRNGPFGLSMGMKLEEIGDHPTEVAPGKYKLDTVPKPHSAFETYVVQVTPKYGLSWIRAIGKTIQTNPHGLQLKSAFDSMEKKLIATYGKGDRHDFLMAGSIWNEPQDWMMGLLQKERYLMAMWDSEHGSTLPDALVSMGLFTSAIDKNNGYIAIEYSFENEASADAELAATEDEAL